jgi:peptide/nickel transport system permease protein
VGGVLGIVSGYLRGKVELVLNVLVGTLLAFPALVLVIAITAFRGRSLTVISFAIAVVAIPAFARVAYACTLAVAQREYVLAARSLGAKNLRIMVREVLPNVLLPLLAFALVVTAVAIVAEASLAFLGLSVSLGTPSWGSMIDAGRKLLIERGKWTISFFPALAMFLTVLSLNLLGEKVREFVDPRDAKL